MSQAELPLELERCDRCGGSGLITHNRGKAHAYSRRCMACCHHPEEDRTVTVEKAWPACWAGGRRRRGVRVNCGRCSALLALPCIVDS